MKCQIGETSKFPPSHKIYVTEPFKEISYPVTDLCRRFTKLTGPCAYTLHSNPIPPRDGTNGLSLLVAYISQTGHQCFPACFCHPIVGNFDVSPHLDRQVNSCLRHRLNLGIHACSLSYLGAKRNRTGYPGGLGLGGAGGPG